MSYHAGTVEGNVAVGRLAARSNPWLRFISGAAAQERRAGIDLRPTEIGQPREGVKNRLEFPLNPGRTAALAVSGILAVPLVSCIGLLIHTPVLSAVLCLAMALLAAWLAFHVRRVMTKLDALVQCRAIELEIEVRRRQAIQHEMVEICRREQERIGHELHDKLGGNLAGVAFRLKSALEDLQSRGAPEQADCREALGVVNSTLAQVRGFARLLDPVDDGGVNLELALAELGAEMKRVFGVVCAIETSSSLPKLTCEQQRHLYGIVQESIRNAVDHAAAKAVVVDLREAQGQLQLFVHNDGLPWQRPDPVDPGLGLRIIGHRADLLGGTLSIGPNGHGGTVVSFQLPLAPPKAHATDARLCAG